MDLGKLVHMFRAYRRGAPLGDVVVLKLDALSAPPTSLAKKLERVRGHVPEQDVHALRRLPAGTLGREYARFLDANRIAPLVISTRVRERFRDNPYPLRYTTTHGLHHVLTGFDTGLAGEIGVLAFTVGQGSAPVSRALFWVARVLYAILSPTQARSIWRNARIGFAMGKGAELVIAEPIESSFEKPLGEVRSTLRIVDARAAGAVPSGTSLVMSVLFPPRAAA